MSKSWFFKRGDLGLRRERGGRRESSPENSAPYLRKFPQSVWNGAYRPTFPSVRRLWELTRSAIATGSVPAFSLFAMPRQSSWVRKTKKSAREKFLTRQIVRVESTCLYRWFSRGNLSGRIFLSRCFDRYLEHFWKLVGLFKPFGFKMILTACKKSTIFFLASRLFLHVYFCLMWHRIILPGNSGLFSERTGQNDPVRLPAACSGWRVPAVLCFGAYRRVLLRPRYREHIGTSRP